MAELVVSREAENDLQGIYLYLASQFPERANRITDDILTAVERLADFPESGRLVPERGPLDLREIFVRSYRVIYELVGEDVVIRRIRHGAQRFNLLDFV